MFHAPCAQLVTMGRYRGVGMPRPKKQKPTAIELLHTATVEMEQAAESASSASCAAELTSVPAPPPSPRKQKELAARAKVRLAKHNARESAKAVNTLYRELEVAKKVYEVKMRRCDKTMKKDPVGTLCRCRDADWALHMAKAVLKVSENTYLMREVVVRHAQLAVNKLELARLRRSRATPAARKTSQLS